MRTKFQEVRFMKKFFKLTALLIATLAMCMFLTACSSAYSKVEKALEEIGYEKIESTSFADEFTDDTDKVANVYCFSKEDGFSSNIVIVLEFNATDDMKEFYEESAAFRGLVQDIKEDGTASEFHAELEEAGLAKGNCLIISLNILAYNEVTQAIKNA